MRVFSLLLIALLLMAGNVAAANNFGWELDDFYDPTGDNLVGWTMINASGNWNTVGSLGAGSDYPSCSQRRMRTAISGTPDHTVTLESDTFRLRETYACLFAAVGVDGPPGPNNNYIELWRKNYDDDWVLIHHKNISGSGSVTNELLIGCTLNYPDNDYKIRIVDNCTIGFPTYSNGCGFTTVDHIMFSNTNPHARTLWPIDTSGDPMNNLNWGFEKQINSSGELIDGTEYGMYPQFPGWMPLDYPMGNDQTGWLSPYGVVKTTSGCGLTGGDSAYEGTWFMKTALDGSTRDPGTFRSMYFYVPADADQWQSTQRGACNNVELWCLQEETAPIGEVYTKVDNVGTCSSGSWQTFTRSIPASGKGTDCYWSLTDDAWDNWQSFDDLQIRRSGGDITDEIMGSVTLYLPAYGESKATGSTIEFQYYNGVENVETCDLMLWDNETGDLVHTNRTLTPEENWLVLNTLTYEPDLGYYLWNVVCTDVNGSTSMSAVNRTLYVSGGSVETTSPDNYAIVDDPEQNFTFETEGEAPTSCFFWNDFDGSWGQEDSCVGCNSFNVSTIAAGERHWLIECGTRDWNANFGFEWNQTEPPRGWNIIDGTWNTDMDTKQSGSGTTPAMPTEGNTFYMTHPLGSPFYTSILRSDQIFLPSDTTTLKYDLGGYGSFVIRDCDGAILENYTSGNDAVLRTYTKTITSYAGTCVTFELQDWNYQIPWTTEWIEVDNITLWNSSGSEVFPQEMPLAQSDNNTLYMFETAIIDQPSPADDARHTEDSIIFDYYVFNISELTGCQFYDSSYGGWSQRQTNTTPVQISSDQAGKLVNIEHSNLSTLIVVNDTRAIGQEVQITGPVNLSEVIVNISRSSSVAGNVWMNVYSGGAGSRVYQFSAYDNHSFPDIPTSNQMIAFGFNGQSLSSGTWYFEIVTFTNTSQYLEWDSSEWEYASGSAYVNQDTIISSEDLVMEIYGKENYYRNTFNISSFGADSFTWGVKCYNAYASFWSPNSTLYISEAVVGGEAGDQWWDIDAAAQPGNALYVSYSLLEGIDRTENCTIYLEYNETENFEVEVPCESTGTSVYMSSEGPWDAELRGYDTIGGDTKVQSIGDGFYFAKTECDTDDDCPAFMFCADSASSVKYCEYKYQLNARVDPDDSILFYWKAWVGTGAGVGLESTYPPSQNYFLVYVDEFSYESGFGGTRTPAFNMTTFLADDENITAFEVDWPYVYVTTRNDTPCTTPPDEMCNDTWVTKWLVNDVESAVEQWKYGFQNAQVTSMRDILHLSDSADRERIWVSRSTDNDWYDPSGPYRDHSASFKLYSEDGTVAQHGQVNVWLRYISPLYDAERVEGPRYFQSCDGGGDESWGHLRLSSGTLWSGTHDGFDNQVGHSGGIWTHIMDTYDCTITNSPCPTCVTCGGSSNARIWGVEEDYEGALGYLYTSCSDLTTDASYVFKTSATGYPREAQVEDVLMTFSPDADGSNIRMIALDNDSVYALSGVRSDTDIAYYDPVIYELEEHPTQNVGNMSKTQYTFQIPTLNVVPTIEADYGVFANGTCSADNRYCPWYGYYRFHTDEPFESGRAVRAKGYLVVSEDPIDEIEDHRDWEAGSPSSQWGLVGLTDMIFLTPDQIANDTGIDMHAAEIIEKDQTGDWFLQEGINISWNRYDDYNDNWLWCLGSDGSDYNICESGVCSLHFAEDQSCSSYQLLVNTYNSSGNRTDYQREMMLVTANAENQDYTRVLMYSGDNRSAIFQKGPGGQYQVPTFEPNHTYEVIVRVNTYKYIGGNDYVEYTIEDTENITIQGCSSSHYPRECPEDQGYVCAANLSGFPVCQQPGDYVLWANQVDFGIDDDNYRVNITVRWADNDTVIGSTCPNGETVQIAYLRAPWTSGVPPSVFTELSVQTGSSYIDYLPRLVEGEEQYKHIGDMWRYRAMVYCGPLAGYARADYVMEECYNDTHCPGEYFCKTWPNAVDPDWPAQCMPRSGNDTVCYRDHECIGGNCTTDVENDAVGDYPRAAPGDLGGYANPGFCYGAYVECDMSDNLTCTGNQSCQPFFKGQSDDQGYCQDYLGPGDDCLLDPPEGKMTELTHACTEYWDHTLPEGYDDDKNYMGMTAWCDPTLVCVVHQHSNGGYYGTCEADESAYAYEPNLCGVGQLGEAARCAEGEYCARDSVTARPTCYSQKNIGDRCENDYQCLTKQCMGGVWPPCDRICYTCEAECLDYGAITCNWDATEDEQPPAYEGFCDVLTERCYGDVCVERVSICDSYYTGGTLDDATCPECEDNSDCEIGLECEYLTDIDRSACVLPQQFCNTDDDCNLFTEFCNLRLPDGDYDGTCAPKRDDGDPCLYKNINTIGMCQMGEYCEDGECVGNNPATAKLGYVTNIRKEGDTCFTAQGPEGWEENDYFIMSDDEQFGTCSYVPCDADGTLHNSGATDDDTSCADVIGDRAPTFVFCVGEPDLVHIISGAGNELESNVYKYETTKGIEHGANGYCMWKSEVGEPCYGDVQCISAECVGERSSDAGELGFECDECNETSCYDCSGGTHIYKPRTPTVYLVDIPAEAMGLECYCNATTCNLGNYSCSAVGSDPWTEVFPDNTSDYQALVLQHTGINCTVVEDMLDSSFATTDLDTCVYNGPTSCGNDIWTDDGGGVQLFIYANPNCGYPWNQSDYDDMLTDTWNVSYVAPGTCVGIPCDANWGDGIEGERECPSKLPTCNINTNYCEPAVVQLSVEPANAITLSRDADGDFIQSCAHETDGVYTIDTAGVPLILTWEATKSGVTRSGEITTTPVMTATDQIDLCEFLSTSANDDDDPDHEVIPLVIKGLDTKTMKTHESREYDIRVVEEEFNFRFVDCRYESDIDEPYCNISAGNDIVCSSGYDIIVRADAPIKECKLRIGKDAKNWSEERIVYLTDDYNQGESGRLGSCSQLNQMTANGKLISTPSVVILSNVTEYAYVTLECTDDLNVSVQKTYSRNPVKFATSYKFTPEQQIFLMLMVLLLIPSLILLFARGRGGF